jgi:hypothetical protein
MGAVTVVKANMQITREIVLLSQRTLATPGRVRNFGPNLVDSVFGP